MTKKPDVMSDDQFYLTGDVKNTLLYQIREEQKEINRLLKELVKQKARGK